MQTKVISTSEWLGGAPSAPTKACDCDRSVRVLACAGRVRSSCSYLLAGTTDGDRGDDAMATDLRSSCVSWAVAAQREPRHSASAASTPSTSVGWLWRCCVAFAVAAAAVVDLSDHLPDLAFGRRKGSSLRGDSSLDPVGRHVGR